MRRIPVLPTCIVLLAVAMMIGLGFWQLQRKVQKEALLARFAAALVNPALVPFPVAGDGKAVLYRRATFDCQVQPGLWDSVGGRNAAGESGYVHIAHCQAPGGMPALVQLGWSRDPHPPQWDGGRVTGRIAPFHKITRLVADPPLAGLGANAAPDPSDIPNNHLAYAVQWFLFAAVALVIYALALRRRAKGAAVVVTMPPGR
ncbi:MULTISPECIES: SURF1 family protein [unclassified Novosphingobium]|uniref:SURF1 family protein n=1 Tax=unclassified Novosphingobium TaxID=2644732 RepID=UPI000D32337F|nr:MULTISPECIES: SURF1 family protein [unclassified Novosphingobium]PTR09806.1 surfeit locus 1 family protein [Novosphingobium sp. GV055]PUB02593.1 surfeit locus 1 family protein [Novosphingobium sp. GV061]PUB19538.1 surfeit locus 1 family protein [Novosphingobium sp. GV079]PUB40962.1 surfeit locus 1 family protein [Novosphingobium sp. GV027]